MMWLLWLAGEEGEGLWLVVESHSLSRVTDWAPVVPVAGQIWPLDDISGHQASSPASSHPLIPSSKSPEFPTVLTAVEPESSWRRTGGEVAAKRRQKAGS